MNARTRSPRGPLSREEEERELVYAAGCFHPYIMSCRERGQRALAERLERVRAALLRVANVPWYGEADRASPLPDPTPEDLQHGRQLLDNLLASESWSVPDEGMCALLGRAWAALLHLER